MLHRSFHDFANLCSGGGGTAIDAKELTKATLANAMWSTLEFQPTTFDEPIKTAPKTTITSDGDKLGLC